MIEIKEVGLIEIEIGSLAGLSSKTKWATIVIVDHILRLHFESSESRGAYRVRYYKTGAQIQAEDFIKEHGLSGVFSAITRPRTISINLDKGL